MSEEDVTVCKKIDLLSAKFDEHVSEHRLDRERVEGFITKVEALMETKSNFAFLFKGILGIGALAAAWAAIKGVVGK